MDNKVTLQSTVVALKGFITSEIGDEAVILGMDKGVYYGVNEMGNLIWKLVQTSRPVMDIRETVLSEFDVDPQQCEADILRLLTEFADEGLIEVEDGKDR